MHKTTTIKIVLNKSYGGFTLSTKAIEWLKVNGMILNEEYDYQCIDRTNPLLIQCVETLGSKVASGECSELSVEEIEVFWEIDSFDGKENVSGSVSCY